MNPEWLNSLLGGVLIGIAVSGMLLLNGRITGVSGILSSAIRMSESRAQWRWAFLLGLVTGGFMLFLMRPEFFSGDLISPLWTVIAAGFLVGFGTTMGSGCTSGHGVCGVSRLSPRSLVATAVFILAGIISVAIFRYFGIIL